MTQPTEERREALTPERVEAVDRFAEAVAAALNGDLACELAALRECRDMESADLMAMIVAQRDELTALRARLTGEAQGAGESSPQFGRTIVCSACAMEDDEPLVCDSPGCDGSARYVTAEYVAHAPTAKAEPLKGRKGVDEWMGTAPTAKAPSGGEETEIDPIGIDWSDVPDALEMLRPLGLSGNRGAAYERVRAFIRAANPFRVPTPDEPERRPIGWVYRDQVGTYVRDGGAMLDRMLDRGHGEWAWGDDGHIQLFPSRPSPRGRRPTMREHKPWCEEVMAEAEDNGCIELCTCERREGERRKRDQGIGMRRWTRQNQGAPVRSGTDRRTGHPRGSEGR